MDVASTTRENITEVLTQILAFTERRKEILTRNIVDFRTDDFVPQDLPAGEFARCMTRALAEHLCRNRLLFCDSSHVRFESNGAFSIDPVPDPKALDLLQTDPRQYVQIQIQKLSENMMNNRIAAQLLRQVKNKAASAREYTDLD